MDLSTTYLGLKLKNPVVPSASPLSKELDAIKQMEDAGASAIVMYSLFEEQINLEAQEFNLTLTKQPRALIVYRGSVQIEVPMCYLYSNDQLFDFREDGPCLSSALFIMPSIEQTQGGALTIDNYGASLFLKSENLREGPE